MGDRVGTDPRQRGVVAEGAVGSRWAGRLRIFRYELRFWREGWIPDVGEAVDSPRRLTDDPARAPAARARLVRTNASVGARRAAGRRNVEFELLHRLAGRAQRSGRGRD
jgi:hypothetical protein